MNEDTALTNLVRAAEIAVQAAVKKAFEDGIKRGREEAARELQGMAARLTEWSPETLGEPEIAPKGRLAEEVLEGPRRAASGTVRPAIISALTEQPQGLRASKLASWTNLTENTVRGTLRAMRLEGIVEKRGELWLLSQMNEAADADPGQGSSTASVNHPAQGREAGPGGGI